MLLVARFYLIPASWLWLAAAGALLLVGVPLIVYFLFKSRGG
jgi:hypothetical protein